MVNAKLVAFTSLAILSLFVTGCSSNNLSSEPLYPYNFDLSAFRNASFNHLEANSFELLVPVEEDLRFPVNDLKVGPTNPPEVTAYTLNFASNRVENVYVVAQMSHTRAPGTNISGHMHWQTDTNAAGDVVWAISYSCASIGDSFPAFQTLSVVDSSEGDSTLHLMSPGMIIPAETLGVSGICKVEIYRDTDDIRDTYPDDANLLEFDIHYLRNSFGETVGGYVP